MMRECIREILNLIKFVKIAYMYIRKSIIFLS